MNILRLMLCAGVFFMMSVSPTCGEDTIKIGAVLSVTGPASFLGAPEARTIEMLTDEINTKGGVNGKKLELIIKDSTGSPEKAISFAKQLIEKEKVFAIIGPSTSGETMAIKNVAEEGKTILMSCAAAELIVNPVAKYVFKTPQKDSCAVTRIFQQMEKMRISRIGVLTSNTGFGKADKEQIEKLAPEHGIQILVNEVYDKAATDLTAEVTKLKASNVQAAGAAAEGVIFPAGRLLVADLLPAKHPQKAVLESYKKAYEAKYKEDVSTFGGHAYDAFVILVRAIREAGADKEKARTAIENMKGLVGIGGVFNFSAEDHNGLDINSFEMLTVKKGKFAV
ncbi:MAG: ABC transporter substrate-binding protein [Thermodesulfovibrionales bacterium]